jgi:predicted O-linked N-acetylglucosamine transferase (SPINDLY family)
MQNSGSPVPAEPISLLQATESAFALASQGGLPIIDLFGTAQRLTEGKHPDIAIQLYRIWLERTDSPIAYVAQFNLAVTLTNVNDDVGAEAAYRAAITQKPTFIEGHFNLGTLLERTNRPEEALAMWRAVLTFVNLESPADRGFYLQALNNLGRLLEIRKELVEAEAMFTRSLKEDPKQMDVMTHWVHLRQKLCEWPVYYSSEDIAVEDMIMGTSPLAMLGASDDPAQQLETSRRYVDKKVLKGVRYLSSKQSYGHERLRIGYLSSDFCAHAVSILTAELYSLHDRSKVEVFGFCWSHEDGSPLRARVIAGMDHHIKIGALSDEEAAYLIRSHEIDILVDLHGLTRGTRHNILSYRPAPVQITWLGFPGPTSLPEIDYVLSDPFVFPPELEPFFTEKPLHMPHTFQINDRQRIIGLPPSKESCGLPEDAFVFCSFNNNFKFTPEVFGTWMRILKRTPGSILWLVADNDSVRENLCEYAEKQGIARDRLHFAGRVGTADYLARFQLADLFLDTFPFGAGTTASDALWAGLPLLTYTGRTFASRMAGSLLKAVDLPELITYNLQDYENKAVELAEHPERVAAMKQQLIDNRMSCVLFDTPSFVRDLEQVFEQVAYRPSPTEMSASQLTSSYVQVGRNQLAHFDALRAGIIFTGWIGKNAMSPERSAALQSIFQHSGRPVVFITDETIKDWEVPGFPFHPAYPLLSEVHKADYLRVYVLHHFGGGYTDIKPILKPWTEHFEKFNETDCLALGYRELSPSSVAQLPGTLGEQLREYYAELIGVCSLIFRRHTALTTEWINNTHRHLDEHFATLQKHPAQHPMDHLGVILPDGSISQYPFEWTGVGGNQFHPAILKFRHRVLQADIIPQLHAYR